MKNYILLCLLVGLALPYLVPAQTEQITSTSGVPASISPAKDAHILGFQVGIEGVLHIIYNDGVEVKVPKERGRFAIGEQILTQETFSDIQVADDHQYIGWIADYMICQQSYPCPAELVIYRAGRELMYISPLYGIIRGWKFLEAGKQIVVQSGFPHGDETGAYALYDTESGRQLAEFSSEVKKTPNWVEQLRRSKR